MLIQPPQLLLFKSFSCVPCKCVVSVCLCIHLLVFAITILLRLAGLDRPGIQYMWRRYFSHPPRPALGPTQPPTQWLPGLCPLGTAAEACQPPPPI